MKNIKFLLIDKRVQLKPTAGNVSSEKDQNSLKSNPPYHLYLFIILFSTILNFNNGRTQIVNEQWVARYSSSGNSNSEGADVITNNNGDVYVTGNITESTTSQILTNETPRCKQRGIFLK